ncbi:nucleoside-diphosphate sugar epimerase [Lysinibacillus yapensis]|uniref:Nucleoside-diphosphate sugar epimerase n=1 Tax=Ureibacillus yapensis TaxID=2304605 RepID=A0A396SB22_9BACL|nr:nucleoside-diphosphate sugar epimerase [Lysinibacillus yapensis]RHW38230.1 nucleoside-diphosphate sugar epimerase [Lysinibacillus yapensis]
MELNSLQKSLTEKLTKNSNISILQADTWCVPVHTLNITYKPVIRTKMDILMKMLFLSLKETHFESPEQISEILLVEPLFVHDLLSKMQKTGLISKTSGWYELTDKGKSQFANGVFEEEQDEASVELLYSPTHESFLKGDIEEVLDYEDFPEKMFRYASQDEPLSLEHDVIIAEIKSRNLDDQDGEEDTEENLLITSLDGVEDMQVNDVPCIEFVLYNQEKDNYSCRIWNTLIDGWDEKMELLIQNKEKTSWRKTLSNEK